MLAQSHNVVGDLPFGLMRLKQGLQRVRCGAIANLQKRTTLLITDGPYRTDYARTLQGFAARWIRCKNSRDVRIFGG